MARTPRQAADSTASVTAILDAALDLFSTQGFRATSMRQISTKSGVSVGNIYHHFSSKELILNRLIEQYWELVLDPELPLNKIFAEAEFPEDLERMAEAIEQIVSSFSPYILLIYVDVIEFRGEHIRAFYEGMAARFADSYGERLRERQRNGEFGDVNPMVAVMVATRWLFYFYTIENCFGVPMHFGMKPREAVGEFIRLLRYGLLPRPDVLPPNSKEGPNPGP